MNLISVKPYMHHGIWWTGENQGLRQGTMLEDSLSVLRNGPELPWNCKQCKRRYTSTVCRVVLVQRFEATGSVSSDNHRSREEPDSAGIPCPWTSFKPTQESSHGLLQHRQCLGAKQLAESCLVPHVHCYCFAIHIWLQFTNRKCPIYQRFLL